MDEQLAALSERVAAAADAWLTDPQDLQVYGRLVQAVQDRRVYLNQAPDQDDDFATSRAGSLPPSAAQPDEVLNGLADRGAVQPVGNSLRGADPRQVLARLRGVVAQGPGDG